MLALYKGFDALDVSFAARIDTELCQALEAAKEQAQADRRSVHITSNGILLEVAESGAKGGYAFRCATGGDLGIIWFFKRPTPRDAWGVRASCRSFGLATKGLGGMRTELYSIMKSLGVIPSREGGSIGRVDYAVDVWDPEFNLVPEHFVMHSQCNREDHHEAFSVNGRSGRTTSVTIGKMPGRQVIVYDKRAEVMARAKVGWWTIWNTALAKLGLPALDPSDPSASRIWRVEIRAGKKHLKEKWAMRRWEHLDEYFGNVAAAVLDAFRHTCPTHDSNRSRWPQSPLWGLVKELVADDLSEMTTSVAPNLIKEVQLAAHDQMLAAQMAGLLTTRAALHQSEPGQLASFAHSIGEEMSIRITDAPAAFGKKLAKAKDRYGIRPTDRVLRT